MKLKSTAIAMAVAGTVAAPVAVQAGADEIYASARIGIWNVDQDGVSDLDVRSFDSRFGATGETDLGNGLTGFGTYELDVDFNTDIGESDISVRHRFVGLKGDFGSVLLGQTYHTFYNYVVGPLDIPWWHSGYAMVNYRSRTDKAITYDGGAGAVSFGASLYFISDADEEAPDEIELGFSYGLGNSTLALAYQSTETTQGSAGTDDDIVGIAWSGIGIGDTTLGVSFMNQDADDGLVVDWVIGNAYLHVESLAVDATDQDILSLTLGYTQSLSRKTSLYYEINNIDYDTGNSDDDRIAVMAVLTYEII